MLLPLRRLIEELSEAPGLDPAARLIVERVQGTLGTDVCSIYLRDAKSSEQVLIATQGLNPDAVGSTRLDPGEGVIGLVAEREEPVNLEDAFEHPRFKYLPETGEADFHSFLGVPLIHAGHVLGVLAVQQRARRQFSGDEEAFLLTVGAQLAGFIAHALASGWRLDGSTSLNEEPDLSFLGQPGSPGAALGVLVVVEPPADLRRVPDRAAQDAELEVQAFDEALSRTRAELLDAEQRLGAELSEGDRALFLAYRLMLEGESFADEVRAHIRGGMWAPGALRTTISRHQALFDEIDDPYLRERGEDVQDLASRVLSHLQGRPLAPQEFPERTVLAGDRLSVVELARVPRERLVGIVSIGGSVTSHVAVFARSLGIPAVVGAEDLPLAWLGGREVVVDGYGGQVIATPSPETRARFRRVIAEAEALDRSLEEILELPAESPDGHTILLHADLSAMGSLARYHESGARGVGLFRTEYLFMARQSFPSEREQCELYERLAAEVAPESVALRTLDIGSDKTLPYFPIEDPNPSLGWRGIRVALDHPEILLTQLRAMILANREHRNLRILLPMIATVSEVDRTLVLMHRAHEELVEEGFDVTFPPVGAMVEVPSAVYQAGALARRLDFLSIGANDLTQYLLAVDRGNARVADLFDSLHPAVLGNIRHVVQAGHGENCPVGLCGAMAADPAAAVYFAALGLDHLSAVTPGVPRVKAVIRGVPRQHSLEILAQALDFDSAEQVRELAHRTLERFGLHDLVGPQD